MLQWWSVIYICSPHTFSFNWLNEHWVSQTFCKSMVGGIWRHSSVLKKVPACIWEVMLWSIRNYIWLANDTAFDNENYCVFFFGWKYTFLTVPRICFYFFRRFYFYYWLSWWMVRSSLGRSLKAYSDPWLTSLILSDSASKSLHHLLNVSVEYWVEAVFTKMTVKLVRRPDHLLIHSCP